MNYPHINKPRTQIRLFSLAAISFVLFGFFACNKNTPAKEKETVISKLNSAFVKEWYYGEFKKSPAWTAYNSKLHGLKLPAWSEGQLYSIGEFEVIEFPLTRSKSQYSIDAKIPTLQKLKLAESSVSKILFIRKKDGSIVIREIDYTPAWDYAVTNKFDLSFITSGNIKQFSGRALIRRWNGTVLNRLLIEQGKIIKTGNKMPQAINYTTQKTQGCDLYEICEYERECPEVWFGDVLVSKECGEWQPTGNCWYEEYCTFDEECPSNLSGEECACLIYNICDNINENECIVPNIEDIQSEPASETIPGSLGSVMSVNRQEIRKDPYNWYYNTSRLLGYTWKFSSSEETEAKKINGIWKFTKVSHKSDNNRTGTLPPCVNSDAKVHNAVGNVLNEGTTAKMSLDYIVRVTVTCCGYCPDVNSLFSSEIEWSCKQN